MSKDEWIEVQNTHEPLVVGIPGITTLLKTGMKVRVHGDTGVVEILDSEYVVKDIL